MCLKNRYSSHYQICAVQQQENTPPNQIKWIIVQPTTFVTVPLTSPVDSVWQSTGIVLLHFVTAHLSFGNLPSA